MVDITRQQKIDSYGQAHAVLTEALKNFRRDMWKFRPAEGWSIHEIICHITDAEARGYFRLRKFLAEPGSAIMLYDQPGWATHLHYQDQSTDDALALFQMLRKSNHALITTMPDSAWANTVEHPSRGTVSMEWFLDTYEGHVPAHIRQMQGVYDEWHRSKAKED